MTALVHREPRPQVPLAVAAVLHHHSPASPPADGKGWLRRLHRSHSDEHAEAKPHAVSSPEIEPSGHRRHRFSLSRLFKPDDHAHRHEAAAAPPAVHRLEIPPLLLMNERNGGVTVSGRRVPFTRDAHRRRRRKAVRPLPRVNEDRALGQTTSQASVDAYRRRAYYAKPKDKKK